MRRRTRTNRWINFHTIGTAIAAALIAGPAAAGWRDWFGLEPKPEVEENSSFFSSLEPLSLILIAVLLVIVAWAMRHPGNIRRGIAEGFGRALGSFAGWTLASCGISVVGAIAGMVATGSYTFASAAIYFVCIMIACVTFFVIVMLNS